MQRKLDEISEGNDSTDLTSRRDFFRRSLGLAAGLGIAPALFSPETAWATGRYTEWGWPTPYRRVSQKSVQWLKSKGWWPLQVAWNPLWSDGNVVLFVMMHQMLLEKRGIEVHYVPLLAAANMNEVFVPGKVQVAQAGSLGLLRLIDLSVPTAALAVYPAQRQAFLVHPDSPLKSFTPDSPHDTGLVQLKGQKVLHRPAVVGITIGSTTHMGWLLAAKTLGLEANRDYVIKNTAPPDIITMPQGIDVVGMWEPNVLLMTQFRKNARIVELIDRYEIFTGYSYMRGEIETHAPDVVQAYADAFTEAVLYSRLRSTQVLKAFAADPSQLGREPKLIEEDAATHVFDPKPTLNYIFLDTDGFYVPLEVFQAGVMYDAGILKRRYGPDDYRSVLRPQYLKDTYKHLGWKTPSAPAFLPEHWSGKVGNLPYPPYGLMYMGKQAFPAPGDLTRPWSFGGKLFQPA